MLHEISFRLPDAYPWLVGWELLCTGHGRGGYRVDLYRELMRKNGLVEIAERRKNQLFRKMMVLNTARVQVLEPELTTGGNRGYVETLYNYFQ